QVLALGGLLIGSGFVILWLRGDNARIRPVHVAAVALLAVDLMLASWGFNAASDPALLDYVPPAVVYLQEHAQNSRYTVLNTAGRRDILQANMTMRYGLDDVRGYDSIISKQYVDYMEPIHNPDDLLYNRISPLHTSMKV